MKTQEDLELIYKWKSQNNRALNGPKFNLLRYGNNVNLKDETIYFTEHMENVVERKDTIWDLGLILDDNLGFKSHVVKVTKAENRVGVVIIY